MENPFSIIVPTLAGASLLLEIITALLIVILIVSVVSRRKNPFKKIALFISQNSLPLAFLVVVIATLGSLTFSEVLHFTPCKLCWMQRICMYPQVVILGVGMYLNDPRAKIYALTLSVIGLAIAKYHILVQTFPALFKCSDELANCAFSQFSYFGYITIPVMSAGAFLAIIVILLFTFLPKK